MAERADLTKVINVFINNPFEFSRDKRRGADKALDRLDLGSALTCSLRAGQVEQAERLLLAAAHRRACRYPDDPTQVIDRKSLPQSITRKLPRRLGDYVRIAMAAGRCFRALREIRGDSGAMQATRRDTWSACFGDSLHHALDLESVIRDHDVLLLGETGTGKELFARAIQAATPGKADGSRAPTAAINAAAIPHTLVESELFGHIKGSFTGATDTRAGRLRSANGGAFFLDEVGDLPRTTQVKLLRVIETDEVFPVGSDSSHAVDVRYVAATHKNLAQMVERGEFREDLFQRLAGVVLRIPPLRERPDDIVEIGNYFVDGYLGELATTAPRNAINKWLRSAEARGYSWPGNIRELQNALRNLMLGLDAGLSDAAPTPVAAGKPLPPAIRDSSAPMEVVQDWYLQRVLAHTGGNLTQAAHILGLDRSTVRRRSRN